MQVRLLAVYGNFGELQRKYNGYFQLLITKT
jgi:hypothetical protein